MEELELRQLLSGTLFKVTLVDESARTGSEQMLHLQDGVPTEGDPNHRRRLPIRRTSRRHVHHRLHQESGQRPDHYIVSLPTSGPLVTFSVPGNPNVGGIGVGEVPSSFTITPAVEIANVKLTFNISYTNADGDVIGGFDCPFAFDMRTWIDIGGD